MQWLLDVIDWVLAFDEAQQAGVETNLDFAIKELGGTMPEDLSSPEKGIKLLERKQKRLEE